MPPAVAETILHACLCMWTHAAWVHAYPERWTPCRWSRRNTTASWLPPNCWSVNTTSKTFTVSTRFGTRFQTGLKPGSKPGIKPGWNRVPEPVSTRFCYPVFGFGFGFRIGSGTGDRVPENRVPETPLHIDVDEFSILFARNHEGYAYEKSITFIKQWNIFGRYKSYGINKSDVCCVAYGGGRYG